MRAYGKYEGRRDRRTGREGEWVGSKLLFSALVELMISHSCYSSDFLTIIKQSQRMISLGIVSITLVFLGLCCDLLDRQVSVALVCFISVSTCHSISFIYEYIVLIATLRAATSVRIKSNYLLGSPGPSCVLLSLWPELEFG